MACLLRGGTVDHNFDVLSLVKIVTLIPCDENPCYSSNPSLWLQLLFIFIGIDRPLTMSFYQIPPCLSYFLTYPQTLFSCFPILSYNSAPVKSGHAFPPFLRPGQRALLEILVQPGELYHPLISSVSWALESTQTAFMSPVCSLAHCLQDTVKIFILFSQTLSFSRHFPTLGENTYHQWQRSLLPVPLFYKLHSS